MLAQRHPQSPSTPGRTILPLLSLVASVYVAASTVPPKKSSPFNSLTPFGPALAVSRPNLGWRTSRMSTLPTCTNTVGTSVVPALRKQRSTVLDGLEFDRPPGPVSKDKPQACFTTVSARTSSRTKIQRLLFEQCFYSAWHGFWYLENGFCPGWYFFRCQWRLGAGVANKACPVSGPSSSCGLCADMFARRLLWPLTRFQMRAVRSRRTTPVIEGARENATAIDFDGSDYGQTILQRDASYHVFYFADTMIPVEDEL
ncbi:hypothetical protein MSAN_00671500 [Mycena sanguinolenta]|uniref:Uncharacterized protein n=1 Tax=Mycena sanguinolenta TaxID=230812 RepID=A0A8H6Z707_9AGAR|nr:hypothetical protein MSAN_00671500 [Mycena sanguinolenta]